jgi:hypothetical protein
MPTLTSEVSILISNSGKVWPGYNYFLSSALVFGTKTGGASM